MILERRRRVEEGRIERRYIAARRRQLGDGRDKSEKRSGAQGGREGDKRERERVNEVRKPVKWKGGQVNPRVLHH